MLCHGGSYRADNNGYFIFSFHYVFFEFSFGTVGQFLVQQEHLYFLKENHYSIGTFKEKSFVGNYVSYSLHLTLAMITYSHCRQQTNSEICSANETQMSSWCQKLAMMLPKGCVLQRQDGFSSKI